MNENRVGDILLGFVIVITGVSPAGIFLFEGITDKTLIDNIYLISGDPFLSTQNIKILMSIFGLFWAGVGVFIIRYGRSRTTSPGLY